MSMLRKFELNAAAASQRAVESDLVIKHGANSERSPWRKIVSVLRQLIVTKLEDMHLSSNSQLEGEKIVFTKNS
jgi:hypothetical protein